MTLGNFLEYLSPQVWAAQRKRPAPPVWPPDVFALAAALLQRTGWYAHVVREAWPPAPPAGVRARAYPDWIVEVASQWRAACLNGRVPAAVGEWWATVVRHQGINLEHTDGQQGGPTRDLAEALLLLVAAADEASWGAGWSGSALEHTGKEHAAFLDEARLTLARNQAAYGAASLCKEVATARRRVLPKMRTPQRGISIRSLTHHLALCPPDDVQPLWGYTYPLVTHPKHHKLNLLLLPWPQEVRPVHFKQRSQSTKTDDDNRFPFGIFTYERPVQPGLGEVVRRAVGRAKESVGDVDAVVLPELALRPEELAEVQKVVVEECHLMLITGVLNCDRPGPCCNEAVFLVPYRTGPLTVRFEQAKRHRWCLDQSQIIQYGLGGQLDPSRSWWEAVEVNCRQLTFVPIAPWLTVSVLICEDLARQDMVADLLRSVGPNLVIALLMDGPQTPDRWSARCATALADDPGSSVLTLTSIGMVRLCRPNYRPEPRRVVGLWKDAKSWAPVEITLPPDAAGVVLCLTGGYVQEWTLDGRSDGCTTGQLTLSGTHPVFLDER